MVGSVVYFPPIHGTSLLGMFDTKGKIWSTVSIGRGFVGAVPLGTKLYLINDGGDIGIYDTNTAKFSRVRLRYNAPTHACIRSL